MSADPMSSAEPKASAAPKRRWWRKKRWWAAAIPLALVAYVVSIGPAAYGMGREDALKAITIVPAQIFGVADRLGSIEQGKNATLFICDGDPFEPKTQVSEVFIDGWQIPMVSRQTLLYDEFLKREPGLTKQK